MQCSAVLGGMGWVGCGLEGLRFRGISLDFAMDFKMWGLFGWPPALSLFKSESGQR